MVGGDNNRTPVKFQGPDIFVLVGVMLLDLLCCSILFPYNSILKDLRIHLIRFIL